MFDVDSFVFEMQQIPSFFRPRKLDNYLRLFANNGYGEIKETRIGIFFETPQGQLLKVEQKVNDKDRPLANTDFQYRGDELLEETSLANLDIKLLLNIHEAARPFAYSILSRCAIDWRKMNFEVAKLFNSSTHCFIMEFYSNRIGKKVLFPITFQPDFFQFRANKVIERLPIKVNSFDVLVDDAAKRMLADFDN